MEKIAKCLNEKQLHVVSKRYISEETFDKIGKVFGTTRANIGFIEKQAINIVRRNNVEDANLVDTVLIERKIIKYDDLVKITGLDDYYLKILVNSSKIIKYKDDSNDNYAYVYKKNNHQDIEGIKNKLFNIVKKEKQLVNIDLFCENENVEKNTLINILSTLKNVGFENEYIGISYVGINFVFKAYLYLKERKEPIHRFELYDMFKKQYGLDMHKRSFYHLLQSYNEFLCVGGGMYCLRDQGYIKDTVENIIEQYLAENGEKHFKDIVRHVKTKKIANEKTIYTNLQSKPQFINLGKIDKTKTRFYIVDNSLKVNQKKIKERFKDKIRKNLVKNYG
jgi:hypothetical protein